MCGTGFQPVSSPVKNRCHSRRRARGTVLLMVVAVLGALFLVGAALLSSVTFQSRSITAAKAEQERATVIDAISREIGTALREAAVGGDGKPYNREILFDNSGDGVPDVVSPSGNDIAGELPGVHPLLASTEPYWNSTDVRWEYFSFSDLHRTVEDNIVIYNAFFPRVGVDTVLRDVDLDGAVSDPDEYVEHGSFSTNGGGEYYRRDADGDGVWDTYEYRLPESRYPQAIRGSLPETLRAPDRPNLAADDVSDLFYAVRIIPNGAMVNLNHSHKTLLDRVVDPAEVVSLIPPYAPEAEEGRLRRRFLLPGKELPLSSMQARTGLMPWTLYFPYVLGADMTDFGNGDEDARWWPIDTGENGRLDIDDDTFIDTVRNDADTTVQDWLDLVDPDTTNRYDYRHLITTVSHDDQLMRMGRNGTSPTDWAQDIVGADAAIGTNGFFIDQWPNDTDSTDPLNGRLKVSLPSLVQRVLIDSGDPIVAIYAGHEIDALNDTNLPTTIYDEFVGTLQDTFTMMLWNVDMDANSVVGPPDDATDEPLRTYAAAALTANLIDFADSNDIPTRLLEAHFNFATSTWVPGTPVYGVERQPYISEVVSYHTVLGGAADGHAIELHNPYAQDISLDASATDWYSIRVGGTVLINFQGTGEVLPAGGPPKAYGTPDSGGNISVPTLGALVFNGGDVVELVHNVQYGVAPPVGIVVDQVPIPGGPTGFPQPNELKSGSLQRDTGDGGDPWRVTVPVHSPAITTDGTLAASTLADFNTGVNHSALCNPVQIEFADTGDVATAFPTTGSLLLLGRYANTETQAFTARLAATPAQIDNGRMPLFEQTQLADLDTTKPFNLSIPWGQLVFDYFTALPASYTRGGSDDIRPTVDAGGLRVHGRIDLNSAPWWVIAGLPLAPRDSLPAPFRAKIQTTLFGGPDPNPSQAEPIGQELAQGIVAYREAREINYGTSTGDYGAARLRPYTGFLTIGELANVRHPLAGGALFRADANQITGSTTDDYVKAVSVLVTLGDWVTTRSHVFTVYGTLRGAGTKSAVDQQALRFQETVDRTACFFSNALPRRIGQRVVGGYADAGNN